MALTAIGEVTQWGGVADWSGCRTLCFKNLTYILQHHHGSEIFPHFSLCWFIVKYYQKMILKRANEKVNVLCLLKLQKFRTLCTTCGVWTCTLQRKSDLCTVMKRTAWPQSQFPHSCFCERFIYFHNRRKRRPIVGRYKSLTEDEWRIWDWGHAVS